jgi:hypothetical protein
MSYEKLSLTTPISFKYRIAMEESKQQGKFATPNREVVTMPLESTPGEDHATVTPPTPNGKQVRFDAKPSEQAKRGVVSRRGGRYGSPSRSAIEYPTFRSQNPDSSMHSFPQDEITEPPRMVSSSEGEANIGEEFSSPAAKTEPRHSNFSPPPTESATTDKVSFLSMYFLILFFLSPKLIFKNSRTNERRYDHHSINFITYPLYTMQN